MAKAEVEHLLEEPFTVHSAWADGRGSADFKRYYGVVTTASGRDLAEVLVERRPPAVAVSTPWLPHLMATAGDWRPQVLAILARNAMA